MPEIAYNETLVTTSCWCGINLAVPSNLFRMAHDNGKSIYCPLGHSFGWSDTFQTKYEREQKRVKATRDLLAAEERSHAATRGQMTKLKKRVHAGVCPCCQRSFQNVARHMKTKHPDYEVAAKS
jgi:hypothetical protein